MTMMRPGWTITRVKADWYRGRSNAGEFFADTFSILIEKMAAAEDRHLHDKMIADRAKQQREVLRRKYL